LRDIIEDLVKTSHLDKYLEWHSGKDENSSKKGMSQSPKKSYRGKEKAKDLSHRVKNTIAGGFSGGSESNSARKKYLRQVNHVTELMGQVSFPEVPELSFSENDNDPFVVQVHIIG
jgi:hypothetical protein